MHKAMLGNISVLHKSMVGSTLKGSKFRIPNYKSPWSLFSPVSICLSSVSLPYFTRVSGWKNLALLYTPSPADPPL
jgi:hypothetical protein